MRACVVVIVAWLAAGCGGDPCASGAAGDGSYSIAVDDLCLRGVTATRLEGGAWQPAALELDPAAPDGMVAVIAGDGPAEALRLVIPGVDVDTMFQQGYQSWSFAGTVEVPRLVARDPDGAPTMAAARTGDPTAEELGVSFHAALLRRGESGPVLVIGGLAATRAVTGVAATRGDAAADLEIIYGPAREPLAEPRSEPIYLASAPTPEEALARLGAAMVEHQGDGFTPRRPPGGWFSWNEHFAAIDAALIEAHVDAVADRLAPVGLPLVEIDDGWEVDWGDWRANDAFPAGIEPIAAAATDRGLVAGVWMAPFLVDTASAAAQRPAELFVRDDAGQPIVHQLSGLGGSYLVLDGSSAEAMSLVTARVAELAAAGFTFFKLDFLYAGALPGQRTTAVTGVEALRAGLALIRAAAGPDAVINACGAPVLPVLGIADSLRIGPDTAFDGFTLSWSLVVQAARNLAARAYLWPLVWPDADQVQVRAPFTADEAGAGGAAAALAGPAYSLGDDLLLLPGERLEIALDPVLLDLAGAAAPARPVGLMTTPTDEIATSPIFESFRFLGGVATPPPARFEIVGASGAHYEVTFDWLDGHRVTIDELQP